METYLKQDGPSVLTYRRRDDGRDPANSRFEYTDEIGDWATHYPSHELLVENGWLQKVDDPLSQYERYNPLEFVFYSNRASYAIIPWTQEEIDIDILRQANEDLLVYQRGRDELAFWANKTPQEVIDLIAATPNTFAGFRANDEKIALAVEAITKILKLWIDTGRIPNGE